jgi:teichoic acid transport system permease protein
MTTVGGGALGDGATSLAALAERNGLSVVGGRPALGEYLRDLWRQRYFALGLARARVRAKNSRTVLGPLWNVLHPLLLAGTYLLIFGLLVGSGRGIENFPAYLAVGVFTFHYLSQSVNSAARSLNTTSLVRSVRVPRALMPVVACMQQLVLLGPTVVVLLVLVVLTGVTPTATWLLVLVVFALQTFFNVGLGLVFARIGSHSHDFLQLLPIITRVWFYLSGVFWSVDRVSDYPILRFVFEVNPGYVFLHLNRVALLRDVPAADYATWPLAVAWAAVTLAVGIVFFWHGEGRYGRG